MALTTYGEQLFLEFALQQTTTQLSSLYLGIGIDYTDDGITSELAVTGYSRASVANWSTAINRRSVNEDTIFINSLAEPFGSPNTWGIFDASSGGNCLFTGEISPVKEIIANQQVYFSPGELNLEIVDGAMTTTFANKILDHLLRNTAYTFTGDLYLGFTSDTLTSAITGEVFSGGYARALLGTLTSVATVDNSAEAQNTTAIPFTVSGTWGSDLTTMFIAGHATNATADDLLFQGSIIAISPVSGDVVEVPIAGVKIIQE